MDFNLILVGIVALIQGVATGLVMVASIKIILSKKI